MSIYINTNSSFDDVVMQFRRLGYSLRESYAIAMQVMYYQKHFC